VIALVKTSNKRAAIAALLILSIIFNYSEKKADLKRSAKSGEKTEENR
jgi:hypothetical protein